LYSFFYKLSFKNNYSFANTIFLRRCSSRTPNYMQDYLRTSLPAGYAT
jgi:hypothetical protein